MTDDDYRTIPLSSVIGGALWALVFMFVVVGWICMAANQIHLAIMLAFTACATSAVSATWTIRTFSERTQALIRIAFGLDGQQQGAGRPDWHRDRVESS